MHDNGLGLPEGFSLEKSDSLGLQIVRTLVAAELDGTLGMREAPRGGTDVVLRVPIGRRARRMIWRAGSGNEPVAPLLHCNCLAVRHAR